ncbi:DDE-type integrase/transposase/recombinase [Rhizobium sp. 2YAF20]|uniref:DDE-type integrase/transposase/recombinase n=1 Tax=Rhizobium sp. 2YAF20 TaxID=3233027 RepID=UPI003F97E473
MIGFDEPSTRTVSSPDALVQSRHDRRAVERLLRNLIGKLACAPSVLVTDKLRSYGATRTNMSLKFERAQHKGPNNRAENSHQPTRRRGDDEAVQIRSQPITLRLTSRSNHQLVPFFPVTAWQRLNIGALHSESMVTWTKLAGAGSAD